MVIAKNIVKTFKLSRQQKREMGDGFQGNTIDAVCNISFTLPARSRLRAIGTQWRGQNHRIAYDRHHAQTHFGQHICRGVRHRNTKSSRA